jgi:hypothetical protein
MKYLTFLTNALAITNSQTTLSNVDTLKNDLTNILEKPLTSEIYSNNMELSLNSSEEENLLVKKFKGKKKYLRQFNKLRLIKNIKIVKDLKLINDIHQFKKDVITVETKCSLYVFFAKNPIEFGISSDYILNDENKINKHIIHNLIINNKITNLNELTKKYINSTSSENINLCRFVIYVILTS